MYRIFSSLGNKGIVKPRCSESPYSKDLLEEYS